MSISERDDECVSTKPWSEVLNRSAKLFTFNMAREGGRSFGRVLFFVILGLLALGLVAYTVDSFTGWFSGWFDFWPFGGGSEPEAQKSWFGLAADKAGPTAEAAWYCRWGNPFCD